MHIKKALILLIYFAAVCETASSQLQKEREAGFSFYGIVLDASTMTPIPNSQIFINSTFSGLSGKDGSFALRVLKSDTLRFSVLGYKTLIFNVSDTLSGNEFNAGIFMEADTLQIGEVIIIPRMINLRSELLGTRPDPNPEMDNARFNMAVSRYQGITGQGSLGDPAANYEIIRQKQRIEAYEKGGIPSDKMIGLSPFLLIPAAYLLIHGLPEPAPPLKPGLTKQELDQIFRRYLESSRRNR